jgi:LmbE family N-acetylglucosaminyl deacetylase
MSWTSGGYSIFLLKTNATRCFFLGPAAPVSARATKSRPGVSLRGLGHWLASHGPGGIDMRETGGTILVSAHPDDVALSIGGSILAGFFGMPLVLVTAFSYGGWAPFQSGGYDAGRASELRANEDARFSRSIGARWLQLGLTDAGSSTILGESMDRMRWFSSIMRGEVIRSDERRVGRGTRRFERLAGGLAGKIPRVPRMSIMKTLARFDRAYVELERKLAEVFSRFPDASLASPLALGLHPDHVLVSCAIKSLKRTRTVFYYEDLPYGRAYSQKEIRSHIARYYSGTRPILVDVNSVFERKVDNLRLYQSQLREKDFDNVRKYSRILVPDGRAYERIWVDEVTAARLGRATQHSADSGSPAVVSDFQTTRSVRPPSINGRLVQG